MVESLAEGPACVMKLLVLTPTLGRSPYFPAMVQSLAGIQAGVRHVIVCPAGAISALSALAPLAKIVPQTGPGLYAALNEGLSAAGSDWDAFTWINDDDLLAPAGLNRLLAALECAPNLAAVYGKVDLIDRHGRRLAAIPVAHAGADLGPLLAAGLVPLAQPGTLLRRSAVAATGGFDSSFGAAGDIDYFQRMLATNRRFDFVNAVAAGFRVHGGQISKNKAVVAGESARVFRAAREHPGWAAAARAARRRFKWDNLGAYLGRLLRHGPVTMEELYARS